MEKYSITVYQTIKLLKGFFVGHVHKVILGRSYQLINSNLDRESNSLHSNMLLDTCMQFHIAMGNIASAAYNDSGVHMHFLQVYLQPLKKKLDLLYKCIVFIDNINKYRMYKYRKCSRHSLLQSANIILRCTFTVFHL